MILAIFDLDGTLADTLCDLGDAVNHGLEILGCPQHTYDRYKTFVGNGAAKLCERALPDDRKQDTPRLHELFSTYYGAHYLDKTALYHGAADMLKKLSDNGVALAIATNKPQVFAVEIADILLPGIPFLKVLGGCEERPKKPDPPIIREILDALPETPEKIFMIGDSNVDMETAKNAGLISVGCPWGFRGREELERCGADYIAGSPAEIADIILR